MYLHLGQDVIIKKNSIIGIFDLDNSTVSKHTRNFLACKEREHKVTVVSTELPRSFTLCTDNGTDGERIYLSQLSVQTLEKRNN